MKMLLNITSKAIILLSIALSVLIGYSHAFVVGETSWVSAIQYKISQYNPVAGNVQGRFTTANGWTVTPGLGGLTQIAGWTTLNVGQWGGNPSLSTVLNNTLQAEWTYIIDVRVYDNTNSVISSNLYRRNDCGSDTISGNKWNCRGFTFYYKIDKTHPNMISYPDISENSQYVYVSRSQHGLSANSFDSVSWNFPANVENTSRWSVSSVQSSPSVEQANRSNLKTIYVSPNASSSTIVVSFNLADYGYNGGGENAAVAWNPSRYASCLARIELLNQSRQAVTFWNFSQQSVSWCQSTPTINLSVNDLSMTQSFYFFRIIDNAWNYQEVPVSIVKDSSAPTIDLMNLLTFADASRVLYTTSKLYASTAIPSKFFQASASQQINFASISDWNSNLTSAWPNSVRVSIESPANTTCNFTTYSANNYDATRTFNQNDQGSLVLNWISLTHDFSKVDHTNAGCVSSSKAYRYYRMNISSIDNNWNTQRDKICDTVGNCTDVWPFVFRVVAAGLDSTNSKFTTQAPTFAMANDTDAYTFNMNLKDAFNNSVVPVYSTEDSLLIKDVTNSFTFSNNLYQDMITRSWSRLVFAKNPNWKAYATHPNGWMVNNGFTIKENAQSTVDWSYAFAITSSVPTSDMYPWMGDGVTLSLTSMNSQAAVGPSASAMIKPDAMGVYNQNYFSNTATPVQLSSWWLNFNSYTRLLGFTSPSDYWRVTSNANSSQQSFNNSQMNFPFAAPVIASLDVKNPTEWIKNYFNAGVWRMDNVAIATSLQLETDFFTNQPVNFTLGTDSLGSHNNSNLTIRWGSLVSTSDPTLNMFGSLGSAKTQTIQRMYIQPILNVWNNTIIDVNNFGVGYVSKLYYQIGSNVVTLPWDWRWVSNASIDTGLFSSTDRYYWDSISYYRNSLNNMTLSYDANDISPLAQSIWVSWLVQAKWRVWSAANIAASTSSESNMNVAWNVEKFNITDFTKKKITDFMRSYNWNEQNVTLNGSSLSSLTTSTVNGETIVPVKWDLRINSDFEVDGRITFIVSWKLYLNANIYKRTADDLVTFIVLNETPYELGDYTQGFYDWFAYVDSAVTNLDMDAVLRGSLASYDKDSLKIYHPDNINDSTDKDLFNQLYIRGSLMSNNSLGWSRLWSSGSNIQRCPWYQSPCTDKTSQVFDLIYFRRYSLVDAFQYGGPSGQKVPYVPVELANSPSSYDANRVYSGWRKYCSFTAAAVNCNNDSATYLANTPNDYISFPVYVEYDSTINSYKSGFLRPAE